MGETTSGVTALEAPLAEFPGAQVCLLYKQTHGTQDTSITMLGHDTHRELHSVGGEEQTMLSSGGTEIPQSQRVNLNQVSVGREDEPELTQSH